MSTLTIRDAVNRPTEDPIERRVRLRFMAFGPDATDDEVAEAVGLLKMTDAEYEAYCRSMERPARLNSTPSML